MKKITALLLAVSMAVSLIGCAQPVEEVEGAEAQQTTSTPSSGVLDVDDIIIAVEDAKSTLDEWHRFTLRVAHQTTRYLTAEIELSSTNSKGEVETKTFFASNVAPLPGDWESFPFMVLGDSEYNFNATIVSYRFDDGYQPVPETTDETIKDYIRMTIEDYGDTVGEDMHVVADMHNLESGSFSGEVQFIATDMNGSVIFKATELVELGAFDESSVSLWIPKVDEYSLSYEISDYEYK